MTEAASYPFSDYIVFVDESGDHSLKSVNEGFGLKTFP